MKLSEVPDLKVGTRMIADSEWKSRYVVVQLVERGAVCDVVWKHDPTWSTVAKGHRFLLEWHKEVLIP